MKLLEAQRMAAKGIPVTLDPDRPDFTFEKLVVFDLGPVNATRFQAEAAGLRSLTEAAG